MLSGASEIGFFGKIRFFKLLENNRLWFKPVGKMPTKVCVNAGVKGGILPTLPSTVIFPDCALFAEPQSGKITVRQDSYAHICMSSDCDFIAKKDEFGLTMGAKEIYGPAITFE